MLQKEKSRSIELRKQGFSIKEIANRLGVAKSSVSLWVRNIKLNPKQIKILSTRHFQIDIVEKRRTTRLKNESLKRQLVINAAQREIPKLSKKELWLIGTMLYCAEGGKTQRSLVRFSNGDPEMIKIMMAFFRKICMIPDEKFRGYIHIHPHLDHKKAENFWSKVTNIPLENFFKTYRKPNIASKNARNTLPYGVMDIYICNTELFLKITGWTKGIFKSY